MSLINKDIFIKFLYRIARGKVIPQFEYDKFSGWYDSLNFPEISEPFYKAKQNTDPEVNQIANVFVEYDSLTFTANYTGQHVIHVNFIESYNRNGDNFMANLVIGLETINILSYEPKEIGGDGITAIESTTGIQIDTGTDVRNPREFTMLKDLTKGEEYTVSLQYAGQGLNGEAAIYRSLISVEYKPNTNEQIST